MVQKTDETRAKIDKVYETVMENWSMPIAYRQAVQAAYDEYHNSHKAITAAQGMLDVANGLSNRGEAQAAQEHLTKVQQKHESVTQNLLSELRTASVFIV